MGNLLGVDVKSMQEQYQQVKEEYPGRLIAFRLGDFYEFYGDDALAVSKALQLIVVRARSRGFSDEDLPMVGVPYHAAPRHFDSLARAGFFVVRVDHAVDPRGHNGVTPRRVAEFILPNADVMLDADQPVETTRRMLWTGAAGEEYFIDVTRTSLDGLNEYHSFFVELNGCICTWDAGVSPRAFYAPESATQDDLDALLDKFCDTGRSS